MKKLILKKIIALILCIITIISALSPSVFAWTSEEGVQCSSEVGDYFVGKDGQRYNYPATMYVIWYDENGNTSHHWYETTHAREKYILNYNGERKEVYCVECGISFRDSDNGYTSESANNSNYFNNLPATAREGITLTLIYGYLNSLPAELADKCNLDDFKIAAQNIIWEYQQQIRTSPTSTQDNGQISKNIFYDTIKNRPAVYAYNWLLDKLKNHKTIPSFSSSTKTNAPTHTLEYDTNSRKYTATLSDNNNTLENIKTDSNKISISRNGNKYTITASNAIDNAITITSQKSFDNGEEQILIWGREGKNQTLATGTNDLVYFYFKVKTEEGTGSFTLKKTAEDGKIGGIKFNITGNGVDKTVTTKGDGTVDVTDLKVGTYTVTEITDEIYEDQASQTVTIEAGKNKNVTFDNKLKRGNLTVIKTSEDGKVKNIQFRLYGTSLNGTEINEYANTDSTGTAKFNNILVSGEDGYVLEEIDTALKYIVPPSQNISINWDEVTQANFENKLKRGNLRVTKTAEDGLVQGLKIRLYGVSLSGETIDITKTTDANGVVEFNDILISNETDGYILEEVDTPIRYVVPQTQNAIIKWGELTEKTIDNRLKKFKVEITKVDSETGTAQGNAKLKGAVYGMYHNDVLVDRYTTDSNGKITTKYYTCGDNWTIKEVEESEGYNLDTKVYKVGSEARLYTVEYNTTQNTVKEDIIKGRISLIKHTDDGSTQIETPEVDAEFQVFLKSSGSYDNAKESEKDTLICNNDGYAITKDLPYGIYTVHQVSGWEERELMQDFDVYISKHNKTYKYLINNRDFEAYLKLEKIDEETGKRVTLNNATFKLYKQNGNKWDEVKCKVGKDYIDTWTTNENGEVYTENKLPSGKYKLTEISVPYGFLNLDEDVIFNVSLNNITVEYDDDYDAWITVTVANKQPKATIEIIKSINLREDIDKSFIDTSDLSKIKFRLRAKENIIDYIDGHIIYAAGTEIGTYNLDQYGNLVIDNLNLGEYTIEEIQTLDGLVIDSKRHNVDLNYENATKRIYLETLNIQNDTTLVEISKKAITGDNELEGAKLKVLNENGTVIDCWTSTNKTHKIEGLVVGKTYTLREELAPEGYVIATDIEFTVTEDKETQKVTMIDKIVEVSKTDLVTGDEVEGAKLQVIDEENNIIDEWVSTKEPHKVKGLEENKKYRLVETNAPYGYEISEEIEFEVTGEKVNQKVEMKDKPILTDVKVVKIDSKTKEVIKDTFKFGIYEDEKCTKLIQEVESNKEDGYVEFKELRYGTYYIKELSAPSKYNKSKDIIKLEINDKGVFINDKEIKGTEERQYSYDFENIKITTPNTGDTRNIELCIVLLGMSVIGIVGITVEEIIKRKKQK